MKLNKKGTILTAIILIILFIVLGISSIVDPIKKEILSYKAFNYFNDKYGIKKKDVEISRNYLHSDKKFCLDDCSINGKDNAVTFNYNGNEYKIQYNYVTKVFTDNYQYEEIYNDFITYLTQLFPGASTITEYFLDEDVLNTPDKYNGNIEDYLTNVVVKNSRYNNLNTSVYIKISVADKNAMREFEKEYLDIYESGKEKLKNMKISYDISFNGSYYSVLEDSYQSYNEH